MTALLACAGSALGQPADEQPSPPPPAPEPPVAEQPAPPPPPSPGAAPPQGQPPPYPYQYPYPYPYPYPPYPYPYPQPPPYYYPPGPATQPREPPRPAEPKLPDDRAARTTPFFDALIALGTFEERFGHAFDIGLSAGVFVAGRFRIAARGVLFVNPPSDEAQTAGFTGEYGDADSDSPNVLWGGAMGIAVLRRAKFVISPSLVFLRTDDTDYGSFVGIGIPFEWVMLGGTRVGFEVDVGRAFGGSAIQVCRSSFAPQTCVPGEERRVDRPSGTAFLAQFQVGWGIAPD